MNPVTQPSAESNAEAKIAREVVCVAKATKPEKDEFDSILERTTLPRTLRVLAWVNQFISNSRRHEKRSGPLYTKETETVKIWWIKRIQSRDATDDRTTPGTAFEVIGVDFAGPIKFRKSNKAEAKAYLCIFACSLSRAIHLERLRNLETSTFIMCLKRFIACRGRPRVVYSTTVARSSKLASGWSSYGRTRTRSYEGSSKNTKLIGNLILVAHPGGAASLSASSRL